MEQRVRSKINDRSFDIDEECDFGIIKRIKIESDGMLSHEDDIMSHLQENADLEVEPAFNLGCSANGDDIQQHMDIREPLSTLRNLLEQRLGVELNDYSFWLQDSQKLESHKNLVDQCVQGEGLVQINVQIRSPQRQINIVDVLKPAEEYAENNSGNSEPDDWQLDVHYQKEMERLRIPKDPNEWTQPHVRHWLQWAVRQFNLVSIKLSDWNITGAQLCNMSQEEFNQKVPHDKDSIFWMHLEILKKFKTIAVNQKEVPQVSDEEKSPKSSPQKLSKVRLTPVKEQQRLMTLTNYSSGSMAPTSSRTMNSGQIQLWQFLLELLTDRQHTNAIHWVGEEGEFKLSEPENVAKLWGARKNKRSMNYEKLSRALRYYYDGDIISKVHGKRFVYKFVCDLKNLLGYSAAELKRLMDESTKFY